MARVLFAWELGGGSGHCVNLAPLASGLRKLGHEVLFAARDIHVATRVLGETTNVAQAPILRATAKRPIRYPRTFGQILHNIGFGDDDQLLPLIAAWRQMIRSFDADAVICEHAPSALLTARLCGVKSIVAGAGFVCPPNQSPFPPLAPPHPGSDCDQWSEQLLVDRINRLLIETGDEPISGLSSLYANAELQALLTYQELDHYQDRTDSTYWGTWSPTGGVAPQWPCAPGPRIFAYFQPAQYSWRPEPAIRAIGRMECSAIIYAPHIPPNSLTELQRPNLRIEHRRLDIEKVAAESDVAITHGNNGTATHFLRSGVPQLTIPLYFEQVIFAQRIEALGASVNLSPGRPDCIPSKVSTICRDAQYRAAAKVFQNRYRRESSFERAKILSNRIHEVLRE